MTEQQQSNSSSVSATTSSVSAEQAKRDLLGPGASRKWWQRTTVWIGVAALMIPGLLLEVQCIAATPYAAYLQMEIMLAVLSLRDGLPCRLLSRQVVDDGNRNSGRGALQLHQ